MLHYNVTHGLYFILPKSEDERQMFTMNVVLEGETFYARVEIRYLAAPDQWVISIWDHSSGELLVNMIPLICSYGIVNDLMAPFQYLRDGKGMGSLWVMRAVDEPETVDPAERTLEQFNIIYGSRLDGSRSVSS